LVFRLLQFNAPFRGGYQETSLDKNGNSISVRVTAFARQAGRHAFLSQLQIKEIKQKLFDLSLIINSQSVEPQETQLYSAFVFNDGQKFSRYNFIGEIPIELQQILNFLKVEFEKAEKKEYEEFIEQGKLLKEKYGDWLETPWIIKPSAVGFKSLKTENTALLYLKGVRQPVKENNKSEIPLYYALVFYPKGRIIGGAVAAGGRSDNPISGNGISWTLSEGYKPEKQLIIKYDAIKGTIEIEKSVYQLAKGNLFSVKMDKNWKPQITQLKVYLDKSTDEQNVIALFRKEMNDETIEFR
jgi:hypothetical protein